MVKLLSQLERALLKIEMALLSTVLIGMLVLAFYQVVLRNLFDSGVAWIDIVNRHGVLWIAFLGGAIATTEMRHLNIDVVGKFMPKSLAKGIRLTILVFSIAVTAVLLRAAIAFVGDEIEFGGTIIGDIPIWTFEIIIPVGFGLILFHFVMRLIETVRAHRLSEVPKAVVLPSEAPR